MLLVKMLNIIKLETELDGVFSLITVEIVDNVTMDIKNYVKELKKRLLIVLSLEDITLIIKEELVGA